MYFYVVYVVFFLEERHFIVALSIFSFNFNLGLFTVNLFDGLTFLDELELLLEVAVGEVEGLEEVLAPSDVALSVNDEGLGSVEDGGVDDVVEGLGDGLAGVVGDEGDLEAPDLLGDGVAAGTFGDLLQELLNLFLVGVAGDGEELDFRVLFLEDGEFLVDDVTTLVEGSEEVDDGDGTLGLEVVDVTNGHIKGDKGRESLAVELFVRVGLAAFFFRH